MGASMHDCPTADAYSIERLRIPSLSTRGALGCVLCDCGRRAKVMVRAPGDARAAGGAARGRRKRARPRPRCVSAIYGGGSSVPGLKIAHLALLHARLPGRSRTRSGGSGTVCVWMRNARSCDGQ
eukprot:IDg19614t1